MPLRRGVVVWMSGFLTFFTALNTFGAVTYWISRGSDAVITPYLIGEYIGQLGIETYFWISLATTFIFLGLTSLIIYRKLPPDPEIIKMFVKVGGNLASIRKTVESTKKELAQSVEDTRIASETLFENTNTNLENAKTEMLDTLKKQDRSIRKVRNDLSSTIEKELDKNGRRMLDILERQRKALEKIGRLGRESTEVIKEQMAELEKMKDRLEKIEERLIQPQPKLKSKDDPREIKGIGPHLTEELKSLGITNVGEFIMADSSVIHEKTRVSPEMAERLQIMAQLLMVPGVDVNDAELLLNAGVTSKRELASQDLVQLSRKIGNIARDYVEQGKISENENPTIEQISSWIKMAAY